MSDSPAPSSYEDVALPRTQALTPELIEEVLADFRAWLEQTATIPDPEETAGEVPTVDLHTLLAQFTAMRHEVNLQTKAVRTQQELNTETLRELTKALELLEADSPAAVTPADPSDEALRPLLKTLVDVFDALSLARREANKVRDTALAALEKISVREVVYDPRPVVVSFEPQPSFWSRWFGGDSIPADEQAPEEPNSPARTRPRDAKETAVHVGQLLDSLLTGYSMSVQRVERTLEQHGLEPIQTVGEPFDPEQMEVVEIAHDSGRAPGEVVEEVRRGYLWRGRVFRFAQVSVSKASASLD